MNNDNPHGLRPLGICQSGGAPFLQPFAKAVTYATALFMFDAVARAADGSLDKVITPGTTLYSGVNLNYGAASTATDHLVIVSPDALYEAQDDGSGAGALAADMGLNANLVLTAGNALTKQSKHQIATSTKLETATLDVKLLALWGSPDNAFGLNARIEIMFNKHRMNPGVVGV